MQHHGEGASVEVAIDFTSSSGRLPTPLARSTIMGADADQIVYLARVTALITIEFALQFGAWYSAAGNGRTHGRA